MNKYRRHEYGVWYKEAEYVICDCDDRGRRDSAANIIDINIASLS